MFISNTANTASDYLIERSLQFNSASSQYLTRTFGTPTNQTKWTWSGWVKLGKLGSEFPLLTVKSGTKSQSLIVSPTNDLRFLGTTDGVGANLGFVQTNAVYRDPSAWYHVVCAYDNSLSGTSRALIYVNGDLITTTLGATFTADNIINTAGLVHRIGRSSYLLGTAYGDGYLSEVNFIDGQALTPSDFGEVNASTGQWVAKAYTGTYGNNGFYLDFKDGTSTTTLGYDAFGSNNWTLNNFTRSAGVTDCWMMDVPAGNGGAIAVQPSGNYCVWNILDKITISTLAGANLQTTSAVSQAVIGSIGMTAGLYYWEVSFNAATAVQRIGVYGTTTHTADITPTTSTIGLRFNRDTGALDYTVDGTNYTSIATGLTTGTYFPYVASTTNAKVIYGNFGQRSFAYTPPTDFKALCTANLTTTDVIESGSFTGNANADGVFVWCNGTPETLTINSNAVTWGTHADKLANGFKLRTASSSYNSAGTNTWTATILSPELKSAFIHQNAKGN